MGCAPVKGNFSRTKILSEFRSEKTNPVELVKIKSIKISEGAFINEQNCDPSKYYEILETIGEGSFGVVYRVFKKNTKPPIYRAMKKISKQQQDLDNDSEISLINEINILKRLDHPNIMKIYEYYNTENEIYIISELCEGGELFDKITQEKYFTENSSKIIMKQLFSAIDFCHSNGVIHRDLKPENILLTKKEINSIFDFQIKVIDFGTSARFIKGATLHKIIGTPFYVAPEVLVNNYNEKCDLWSCGVILYIMLCGVPPFTGETDDEIYCAVKQGRVNFDEAEWDEVSSDAKDLIMKLLTKDINKRYSARQALSHPWIKKMKSKQGGLNSNILDKIVKNLKKYSTTQKLQQATLAYIVHNLTKKEDTDNLRTVFIHFDDNGDGRLTKDELIKGLNMILSQEESEKEVNRVMDIIDVDGNGFIEYEEFLRAGLDKDKLLTEDNLKTAFRLFDINTRNKVNSEELKQVLGHGSDNIDDNVWKELVDEIDLNKDGEISFDEFSTMMKQ